MKRYIRSVSDNIPTLKIIVDIYDAEAKIAASDDFIEMKHPSIKKKYRQSDEWLKHVNDLARSILGSMKGRKFNILRAEPSNKSYTYYITFQPANKDGDIWEQDLELQLELRDHVSKTHSDLGAISEKLIVRTYYLNGKTYSDMLAVLKEVWHILDELQEGNFESFVL